MKYIQCVSMCVTRSLLNYIQHIKKLIPLNLQQKLISAACICSLICSLSNNSPKPMMIDNADPLLNWKFNLHAPLREGNAHITSSAQVDIFIQRWHRSKENEEPLIFILYPRCPSANNSGLFLVFGNQHLSTLVSDWFHPLTTMKTHQISENMSIHFSRGQRSERF